MAMNGSFFTLRLEELVVSQAVVVVVAAVGGEKDLLRPYLLTKRTSPMQATSALVER